MSTPYERQKARSAEYQRQKSAEFRDIKAADIHQPIKPRRRAAGKRSLRDFCKRYFPARFPLPFCSAHDAAITRLETCTEGGGLYALTFMRGGGKTTLAEVAAIRAILYGFRRFVVIIQATEKHAGRSLKKIKKELEKNQRLWEDFPEVCVPVRKLGRVNQKASGQTYEGVPTDIEWTADGVVLPTIPESAASGAVIQVAGITGALKGMSMAGPDGEMLRPDLIILDDCQTRESAKSPTMTADREMIIVDDVLGLGGPMAAVAAVNLCTPIYPNDLAERFLDPERHPEWQGERTQMLAAMPERIDLWDQYGELRRASLREREDGKPATEFYKANREEMNRGAVVTWPERRKAGPIAGIDGLELAMILHLQNPRGFAAEYQCQPQPPDLGSGVKELTADALAGRLSGLDRYLVPRECTRLTAAIDCGASLLWYVVTAWNESFGGAVIDYGCWPRQSREFFDPNDARPALKDVAAYKGYTVPQLVFAGLRDLTAEVLDRTYYREGGGELRVELCLIDSGWEMKPVYQFVRSAQHRGILYPSKGFGRTTTARSVSEWQPKSGLRSGHFWRMTVGEDGRGRSVQYDADAWKTFLHSALTTPPGGSAGVFFYGRSAGRHEMIAHHCSAEYSQPVTLRGVTFDKWQVRPDAVGNHWLDCLVGSAVAASVGGLQFSAATDASGQPIPSVAPPRKKVKLSELYGRPGDRAERVRI